MGQVWDADIDCGIDVARGVIERQFPVLRPARLSFIGRGYDNEAFLVNDRYVFRFPRRRVAVRLIERETALLALVAPHVPYPVPLPRFLGSASEAYGFPFMGYERLPGVTACSVTLSDRERMALAPQLGGFLAALHAVDARPLLARGLRPDEIGRFNHPERLALTCDRARWLYEAGTIDDPTSFLAYLERVAPNAADDATRLLHGDLYARHLLLDETRGFAGAIDWGDMHHGHPAIDLSVAHTFLPREGHGAFRESYGPIDDRTWELARYRAIYHSILVAHYGAAAADRDMLTIGRTALAYIAREID